MAPDVDRNTGTALLILRFFLGIFLLQWSVEKLVVPDMALLVGRVFYGVNLPVTMSYLLGVLELILSLALLFGVYRMISYGLALLVHTVTVLVSWRQLLDPYGLANVGNHLWISTWPTWGAFAALFLMRHSDVYTIDGWRESRPGS